MRLKSLTSRLIVGKEAGQGKFKLSLVEVRLEGSPASLDLDEEAAGLEIWVLVGLSRLLMAVKMRID